MRLSPVGAYQQMHASKHFQATGHPIAKPLEEGEEWLWCFADEVMLPLD